MRVRTFFGRIVGLDWIDLTRRAVAEKLVGAGDWAIYAHDRNGCDAGNGLEFDGGAGIKINGRVHSNSRYHVNSGNPESGDQFWAKKGTLDRNTCVASLNPQPQGAAYGDGPEPRDFLPEDWVFEPWPAWYTPGQFNWPPVQRSRTSARKQINIKGDKVELKQPTFGGPDRNINYSGSDPLRDLLRNRAADDERLPQGQRHAALAPAHDRRLEPRPEPALAERPLLLGPELELELGA